MFIIDINGDNTITSQGTLDELNSHQTPRGKFKVNISLYRSNIYQITDLEYICFIFDQVIPVFPHLEVHLPYRPINPKNIGEALKGTQRQFQKEVLFVKYDKNKNVSLLSYPTPIKYIPE